MKPELGFPFSASWEGTPPAMPSQDLAIWLRFRDQAAGLFERIYFNVRVGEPVPVAEDLPPEIKALAVALSRRRVDVVGENLSGWSLFELKYNAGTEALGQILMYKALWQSDPPNARPVSMSIVSNIANKDLILACEVYNVKLLVV